MIRTESGRSGPTDGQRLEVADSSSGDGTVLVVIRGNSASGKSTVAAAVQRCFDRGRCAVVAQDMVRRQMIREFDEPGALNVDLIAHIAERCFQYGMVVIVEGILDADRYGSMLEHLADVAQHALFYSFDLTFAETLARHAGRPQAATIPEEMLAQWYHGWQPLPFVDETGIDSTWSIESIIDRIHPDILATRNPSNRSTDRDAPAPTRGIR